MRKYLEIYFLFFLKPILLITCLENNYIYLINSEFINNFYFLIYLLTFLLKPIFFLILFLGLIINYRLKTIHDILSTFFIILGICIGLPIKELSDFFKLDTTQKFFLNLGDDYLIDEYVTTHYVVNILIENIPIALFVIINNLMLDFENEKNVIIDPIIVNCLFILINGLFICFFYIRKKIE